MKTPLADGKLLAAPGTKLRIAAASLVLLTVGAWFRPQTAAPLVTPPERPAPLLEEQVQQRAATTATFRGVEDVVGRLPARGIALVPSGGGRRVTSDFADATREEPQGFGVVVSDAHVVTHVSGLAGSRSAAIAAPDGQPLEAAVTAFDTATGMVLLSTAATAGPLPVFADAAAQPGALVVAAARGNGHDVAVPVFITSVSADRYGISSAVLPAGMPIYNLDGALLAVGSGDGHAWRIRHVLDRLLSRAAVAEVPSSIGIAFQAVDGALAEAFGAGGLGVLGVVPGGPADVAGLQPGDLITAVEGAGDGDLASTLPALSRDVPAALSIRRGRQPLSLSVTPATAHEIAARAGGRAESTGPDAGLLFTAEALGAAAVPPQAAVLMINGRGVTSRTQAARDLRRARGAAIVLLQHRGQRFFAAIDTGR